MIHFQLVDSIGYEAFSKRAIFLGLFGVEMKAGVFDSPQKMAQVSWSVAQAAVSILMA